MEEERDVTRAGRIKTAEGRTGSRETSLEASTPTGYCKNPGRKEIGRSQSTNRPAEDIQGRLLCPTAFLLKSRVVSTGQLEVLLGNLILK